MVWNDRAFRAIVDSRKADAQPIIERTHIVNRTLSEQLLHDRENGLTEAEIAEKHNLKTVEVRVLMATARREQRMSLTEQLRLNAEKNHWSNLELARNFGLTESEVRILLKGE